MVRRAMYCIHLAEEWEVMLVNDKRRQDDHTYTKHEFIRSLMYLLSNIQTVLWCVSIAFSNISSDDYIPPTCIKQRKSHIKSFLITQIKLSPLRFRNARSSTNLQLLLMRKTCVSDYGNKRNATSNLLGKDLSEKLLDSPWNSKRKGF